MRILRLVAILLPLVVAAPAAAATITVTSTADSGAGSLRAAIVAAPAAATTIVLPAGTITLAARLTVTGKSLTIVGQGPGVSAISGGDTTRIMDVTDASTVAFQQLTLQDGSDNNAAVTNAPAGATLSLDHADVRNNHSAVTASGEGDFLVTGGSLSFSSGTIAGNVAGGSGHSVVGGIVSAQSTAISVTDETITGNVAGGGGGSASAVGGLFALDDTTAPNSTMTLTRVTATNNSVGGGGGSASGLGLVEGSNYDVTATDSTFAGNIIGGGGGTANGFGVFTVTANTGRATHMTLTGSQVTGNSVGVGGSGGIGGAISAGSGAANATLMVDVLNSRVANNVVGGNGANGFGGAVDSATGGASDTSTVNIVGSTLSGNTTGSGFGGIGGAVAVSAGGASSTAALTVDESTIAGNAAGSSTARDGYGGGIEVDNGLTLKVSNATIAGNHIDGPKGHGGGIFATTGTLSSTIVAGNTASDHNNCFMALTSAGHSLESGNECGFTAAGDLHDTDPKLAPLGDYGGPLPTEALLVGSPAANAAGSCTGADERGITRPQGPACDIGAVEAALPAPTTAAPTALTPSTATLAGSVAPLGDPVVATFDTGATTAYGTSLAGMIGNALAVTGPVKGLIRRTTYHARLDATTAAGTVDGNDIAFTTPAPVATVSGFRVSPAAFRPAAVAHKARKRIPRGSSLRFVASDQGLATVTISHTAGGRRSGHACVKPTRRLRHRRSCTRTIVDGSVHFRVARRGTVKQTFSGRIGRHALAPRAYTATLTLRADAAPAASKPARARFTVRRR